MVFRRLDTELTLSTAAYSAGLRSASVETKTFSSSVATVGKESQAAFDTAGASARTYASTVAQTSRANVAARAKENESLVALRAEYAAIAGAATKGSAEQVAASRLVEEANRKLIASGLEVEAVTKRSALSSADAARAAAGRTGVGSIGSSSTGLTEGAVALGLFKTTQYASDLNETVAKSHQVFGQADADVERFGTTAARSLGQSKQQAIEAAATFGNLLRGGGATQADAAKMSVALVKLATDLASFNNVKPGDVLQDLQSGLVGQERPLRQYGILIDEAAVKSKAYQLGLAAVGTELTQQEKVQARYALIFDQSKTAQGDFARTSGEVANETRTLSASFSDMAANMGGVVLPVVRSVERGFITFIDVEKKLHAPVIEIAVGSLAAAAGIRLLGSAFTAEAAAATVATTATAAEAVANTAVAATAGAAAAKVGSHGDVAAATATKVGLLAASVQLAAGYIGIKLGDAASKTGPLQGLEQQVGKVEVAFSKWERHIPLIGGYLADHDQKLGKSKLAHADLVGAVDSHVKKTQEEIDAETAAGVETVRHGKTMVQTASEIGLSQDALAAAIGYQGQVGVEAYAAEEAAAKKFAAAVQQGVDASSTAFLKTVDAVGHFSASSLEAAAKASTKAANTVEKDDTRVADSIQRVADLQEQFAEQAATAREQYASKVEQADQRMADADASYADTVASTNERIKAADDKLAEDRISSAQSVADAQQRLEDDRLAGARSVAEAQQHLVDEETRQHLSRSPAALKRLNDQIALRDAHAAVGKAQESAATKELADEDAVAKAKAAQVKQLAKDQEDADRVRTEAAKAVQKAEESVLKARAEQVKLAEEGLTLGELSLSQQRQMRDAVAAVSKAQVEAAKVAVSSTAGVSAAVEVSTADVKKFYEESLAQGQTFSAGIRTAIERGYDPQFIGRLLAEGPKEAAPLLAAIVQDHGNTLRDIVNASESAIKGMSFANRETARLTFEVVHSSNSRMNADFDDAMRIMEANAASGGTRTSEALARELGIGVERVKAIDTEFGLGLIDGINPVLAGVGAPRIQLGGASTVTGDTDRGIGMALGGLLPGHGGGDRIPLMAEGGEFIFSVGAVDRIGPRNLAAMHDRARKGYAEGGFVTAGDVPPPPDLSMYGNVIGYAGDKVNRFAYDAVVGYLNGKSSPGGGGGAPSGPMPTGEVADWVAAGVALAGRPSSWVSPEVNIAMFESGGDPRAINLWDSNAAAGTPSKGLMQTIDSTFRAYMVAGHEDIWNPIDNVAAATGYIAARYGDPWHTPGELSLARGGAYQGYGAGGLVEAGRGLSVGVMDRGGYLEPGWNLNYNGLGVREPVGAMTGGSGDTFHITIPVSINGHMGTTGRQIAETLEPHIRALFRSRGRGSANYLGQG